MQQPHTTVVESLKTLQRHLKTGKANPDQVNSVLSRSTRQRLVAGQKTPTPETLDKLAAACGFVFTIRRLSNGRRATQLRRHRRPTQQPSTSTAD